MSTTTLVRRAERRLRERDRAAADERLASEVAQLHAEDVKAGIESRRQDALRRADDAVRGALASPEAPETTFKFGPLRIVVTFRSSDPALLAMAAEASRRASSLVAEGWRNRLAAVRAAAAENRKLAPMDGEAIKHAWAGALEFWTARGIARVTVTKTTDTNTD